MDAEDILRESEGAYDEAAEEKADDEKRRQEAKTEITSLDLRFLVRELRRDLRGAIFRKIYQYGGNESKQMIFGFFAPGKDQKILYVDNKKMFITEKKEPAPQEPKSFCMFLRKHLMGKKITDLSQHGFDRIIEVHTADNILIFELFSKGNVILCDGSYNIIMPMEVQRWRHREIRPKSVYRFPPSQKDPFTTSPGSFYSSIAMSEKNLIATLATVFSLGPAYAAELCRRAGVEGMKAAHSVTASEASKMQLALLELDKANPEPCVYSGMVSPFPLESLAEKPQKALTFSGALDQFFSSQMLEVRKEEARKETVKKVEKVQKIAAKQSEAADKWKRIETDSKDSADRIYSHYSDVGSVINGIRKAKDSGLSWTEIKQKVQGEFSPEAECVREIREGDGVVVMDLGGKKVEIDFTKSPEENAARYYEDSKWARGKMKGAEEARSTTEKRLEDAKEEQPDEEAAAAEESAKEETPIKIKKRWYEFYRWFVSSDGFVVIAGKNAQQNENIVKKRMETGDLVFHSDIHGAAFVIIKSEGRTIPQQTIREASEFAAAHSKAWAKGLGNVDVFAAKPAQVSKAGHNLPKGAFVIQGERAWFKNVPIKLSIGIWISREEGWAKVIAGPLMPVRKLAKYFITLRPGFTHSPELAVRIKRSLMMKATPEDKYFIEHVPLEDFQGQIPSGMGDMIESANDFSID